jgi:Rieske Fe-S protein
VAGIAVVGAPLRQAGSAVEVNLAPLDALPVGGAPRLFQIVTDRRDAWTQFPKQAIGSVFLARTSETEVVAFHSSCPHLGCAVEFRDERAEFYCPCHDSSFAKSGEVIGKSPSLRGLDTLAVEVRGGDVWVKFQNFKAGIREKIASA